MDCVRILMAEQEKGHTYGFGNCYIIYKYLPALQGVCKYCALYVAESVKCHSKLFSWVITYIVGLRSE